ncbi:MAG: ArsR/SmtB family transcription factor [Halobaculum sp.]
MSESAVSSGVGAEQLRKPSDRLSDRQSRESTVETEGLELLSDDCARRILEIVAADATAARDISERLDVSRTTVYRRLDRLEEAGLLETGMEYDPDGHHRKVFELAVDRLAVSLDANGVSVDCVSAAD